MLCSQCQQEFTPPAGQTCAGCDRDFCATCAARFETCEYCSRAFCAACAVENIQFPSAITICNDCYTDYIEDTDRLFE